MALSSNKDWSWYVRDLTLTYSKESLGAYEQITGPMLSYLREINMPFELICDEVAETTNLTLPKEVISTEFQRILKMAGFIEKPIPEKDTQGSAELREALVGGSNFNKKWH